MSATVRRLGASDWRLLRDARLRAMRDAPDAFESTYEETSTRPDEWWHWSVSHWAWFVAEDTGGTVGLVAGLIAEGEEPGARSVISMWVSPSHRGAGVAQALMAAATAWAADDGATSVAVRIAAGNERARRFYQRLGFRAVGGSSDLRLALPRPRLRFGPSPAGDLHVGHVRTAVLTWIVSRQVTGRYFVRFENTDRAKEQPGSRTRVLADLEWLGLDGDEPAHDQADMTDAHRAALARLRSAGQTYPDAGAVRFRIPREGTVEWDDLVRGPVSVRHADLPDPVLVRSTGSPTFYLASSVDDADDGISHLVRVDSLLRATATQIHIWRALGAPMPRVGHIPMMAGVRTGATAFTIRAIRERGISPTALLAYLAMPATASWKPPPPNLDGLVDRIDLSRLPHRPVTFDLRAIDVMNRRYPVANPAPSSIWLQ